MPEQALPYQTVEEKYPGPMQAILDNIASRRQTKLAKTKEPTEFNWFLCWKKEYPAEHVTDEEAIFSYMKANSKVYLRANTGKGSGGLVVYEELHYIPEQLIAGFRRDAKGTAEKRLNNRMHNHTVTALLNYERPADQACSVRPVTPLEALTAWCAANHHHSRPLANVAAVALSELMKTGENA